MPRRLRDRTTSPDGHPRFIRVGHRRAVRSPRTETTPKHTLIADALCAEIDDGRLPEGRPLPPESALAERFGVARGTVRRALDELHDSRRRITRVGGRWVAHRETLAQDVTQLRSFGQWARAVGLEPGGRTISSTEGRATGDEARLLGVARRDPVLRLIRVHSLDGRAVMVKRTTFPEWLIPTISQLPLDARSIMEVVERHGGHRLGHGEHRITAVQPDAEDARLLGISRTTPLLRIQRTASTLEGRPFEYSDDRYLSTVMALSVVNTASITAPFDARHGHGAAAAR